MNSIKKHVETFGNGALVFEMVRGFANLTGATQ